MPSQKEQITTRYFILIILIIFLVGCSDSSVPTPNDGSFVNNIYRNNFFNFQIKLPDSWFSVNKETIEAINDAGKDLVAGDDKNLSASIKAAQKNVYNLFSTFQVAPGTPVDFYNSNINCVAEKVSHFPGIKTGEDYLLNAKKLFESGQVELIFSEEIQKYNISGKDFYKLKVTISIMGNEVEQDYYAMFQDGYILAIIGNYLGSEQQSTIHNIINTIEFF